MAYSEQWNGRIAYKAQSALGTPATGAGGKVLRTTGGQGGRLSKQAIESMEVRQDGQSTRGRHGSQRTNGQYTGEYGLGALDDMLAAVMRANWGAADLTITQATMTSATTQANSITAAAGSWITQGLRVGDVIQATGLTDAANNSKNLRITGLTALVITVAETLIVNAVADTSFSIIRKGRVLINPLAGALIKTYYTFEDHEFAIDSSELFNDIIVGNVGISAAPDGLINWTLGVMGTGKFSSVTGASAPSLTTPTQTTAVPMAATEMTLRLGTSDVVDITAFDIGLDLQPSAPPVIGVYAPDVFQGSLVVNMNLTFLRQDLLKLVDFVAETQQSAHILITENEAEPKDFLSIYVPNFTLGSVDKSALAKAGGPRTQTVSVPSALVGIDERGGAFDPTTVKFQVSNAV
jgi:hypothetical protein